MNDLQFALHVFEKTRQSIRKSINNLTDVQLLTTPTGFANNILWNIGHVITLQQAMIYGRSGLPTEIDSPLMRQLFWANTSPTDWGTQPDIPTLIDMLTTHPHQLQKDIVNGQFSNTVYNPRTSGSGIYIESLAHAIHYNNYHEGLHLGAIQALKDFV